MLNRCQICNEHEGSMNSIQQLFISIGGYSRTYWLCRNCSEEVTKFFEEHIAKRNDTSK